MVDILIGTFVLLGAGFCLVAAIGVVRFPDLYVRMHAATKAGTLGAGLVIIGLIISAADLGTTLRAGAALVFLFLTAPVAGHLLARSAYAAGTKLWDRSAVDDLEGKYDFNAETLAGTEAKPSRKDP